MLYYRGIKCSDADEQIFNQPFKRAGELFQVYDTDEIDVLVPYGEEGKQLIKKLLSEKTAKEVEYARSTLKDVVQFSISLFSYEFKQLEDGITRHEIGGQTVYVLNEKYYNEEVGLCSEKVIIGRN